MTIDKPDETKDKKKTFEIKSIKAATKYLERVGFNQHQQWIRSERYSNEERSRSATRMKPKSRQRNRRIKLLITYCAKLRSVDRNFIYLLVRKTNMMAFNLWSCPPSSRCYSLQYSSRYTNLMVLISNSWYVLFIVCTFLFVSWRRECELMEISYLSYQEYTIWQFYCDRIWCSDKRQVIQGDVITHLERWDLNQ